MKKFFMLFSLALLTMSAWAANTYVKVTSLDQMEEGKKYILVNEENSVAMGELNTSGSNDYGTAVDVIINNAVIDIDGTDVVELVTVGHGQDPYGHPNFNFRMGEDNKYIAWVSGNSLTSINAPGSTNALWIPTLTDDGVILKNREDNARILQYNAGAPRFAAYTSSQKPAVLYIQGEPEEEGITTLAQANALADAEQFTFNGDAVVTVFKNGYLFLRDESGFGQIRNVEGDFDNGQVLSQGWNATKTSNNGWVWYTGAENLSASGETNADLAAAIVLSTFPDESMLNAYVVIENTSVASGSGGMPGLPKRYYTLPDGNKIQKTETLWAGNADANTDNFNVYGVIVKVSNTLMINPVATEPYVEPQPQGLRGDVNDDGKVDIVDATALINYLLSSDPTGINMENANCDLEGGVDITDATALINYLLNGAWD